MTDKHTPTPWAINADHIESEHEHGWANDGWIIAKVEGPESKANAAFIVRCVNAHDALVEALKSILASARPSEEEHPAMFKAWQQGHAALSLAEGK